MATATTLAFPIRSLREHIIALEAAITVCLGDPNAKAVHKLRTETRRIEAHLDLLSLLEDLPPYKRKAAKVLRQLRKVRRAAGRVRDLDVQQRLIEEHIGPESEELRDTRQRRRKRAARKLLKLLDEKQAKIALRHESLLKALQKVEDMKLTATDLIGAVNDHFQSLHALIIRNPSEEHLHSIRKAAKVARYQAELAPGSANAKKMAKQFEALQNAGGSWHDWLDLAAVASDELGDDHTTAVQFTSLRDRHLETFRNMVDDLRKDQ